MHTIAKHSIQWYNTIQYGNSSHIPTRPQSLTQHCKSTSTHFCKRSSPSSPCLLNFLQKLENCISTLYRISTSIKIFPSLCRQNKLATSYEPVLPAYHHTILRRHFSSYIQSTAWRLILTYLTIANQSNFYAFDKIHGKTMNVAKCGRQHYRCTREHAIKFTIKYP